MPYRFGLRKPVHYGFDCVFSLRHPLGFHINLKQEVVEFCII